LGMFLEMFWVCFGTISGDVYYHIINLLLLLLLLLFNRSAHSAGPTNRK
jgi:hypothetical protein